MSEPVLPHARTARLDLPYLFPGQAQKEAFVNEAFARLDALVQPSVGGEIATPPADPTAGESYIVAAVATGEWAGREGEIATWSGTHWLFSSPL